VPRSRLPSLIAVLLLVAACGLVQRGRPQSTGPLDVNTASLSDLEQLPGVTPSMARRIFEGRPYGTLDELVERGLLSERELDRVKGKLRVGGPKVRP
jgi:DNA uptake protein ComE-like DNA-binding protein